MILSNKHIGIDLADSLSNSVSAISLATKVKRGWILSTPRGAGKSQLHNLRLNNLCQEVMLPMEPPEMKPNEERIIDRVIQASKQLKQLPDVMQQVQAYSLNEAVFMKTGLWYITKDINISKIREQLGNKYQARHIKYALYCLLIESWIHLVDDWDAIAEILKITFAQDRKHIRTAIYKVVEPRAKLLGKTFEIHNLIVLGKHYG